MHTTKHLNNHKKETPQDYTWSSNSKHGSDPAATADNSGVILSSVSALAYRICIKSQHIMSSLMWTRAE